MDKIQIGDMIYNTIQDYLKSNGYDFDEYIVENLVMVYEDLQEWRGDTMVTGASVNEVLDWLKHTSKINSIS